MEPITVLASLANAALSIIRLVKDHKKDHTTPAEKREEKKKVSAIIEPTLAEIRKYGEQLPHSSHARQELMRIEQRISDELSDRVTPPRRRMAKKASSRKTAKRSSTKRTTKRRS